MKDPNSLNKKVNRAELKKVKFYTELAMKVIISFVLLILIGWQTVIADDGNNNVWFTLLGNLTGFWGVSSFAENEKDKDEENNNNKKE